MLRPIACLMALCLAAATAFAAAPATRTTRPAPAKPSAPVTPAAAPSFDRWWHDGKAELNGYRVTVQRYGQPRSSRAVAIFVTEPFSGSRHVKLDDPAKTPADAVDVLKLNLVRDFQTGVYDYHTMLSVFSQARDFSPLKVTFSSSEWCGQVFEELHFWSGFTQHKLFSYFEGESFERKQPYPTSGVSEDNLWIVLRGLRGPFLKPGEKRVVPYLAGAFWRRLAHREADWMKASIERIARPERVTVPAGAFVADVYEVRPADGRVGRFWIEQAYPRRIVRWQWAAPAAGAPMGGTDAGELTGTTRLDYWRAHDPGDEKLLESLGLGPAVK